MIILALYGFHIILITYKDKWFCEHLNIIEPVIYKIHMKIMFSDLHMRLI